MKQTFLSIMLFLSLMASADDSGFCGDNVKYFYERSTHTLTISGEGIIERHNNPELIPWHRYREDILNVIIESGIWLIGDNAFCGLCNLNSVSFPEGLKTIGSSAFSGCGNLKSITIPKSLLSIERNAFQGCSNLTIFISDISAWCNIWFESFDSNPLIFANHFYLNDTEIQNLIIPSNVTKIGNYCFSSCVFLTSVIIPNSVKSIGASAFSDCINMSSINIPNSIISIGEYAFYECI